MTDHLKESEDIVKDLISSVFGVKYSLKSKIEDIAEIPINDFSMLQKSLSSGEAIIRMAPVSIDGTTFNIISTPFEKRMATVYTFIMILGPIVGIVLSFIYSLYWLSLIVIAPIVSMKLNKRAYLHVTSQQMETGRIPGNRDHQLIRILLLHFKVNIFHLNFTF